MGSRLNGTDPPRISLVIHNKFNKILSSVWKPLAASPIHEPDQIRHDCASKLRTVEVSDHFQAILGYLTDHGCTKQRLIEMVIASDCNILDRG